MLKFEICDVKNYFSYLTQIYSSSNKLGRDLSEFIRMVMVNRKVKAGARRGNLPLRYSDNSQSAFNRHDGPSSQTKT